MGKKGSKKRLLTVLLIHALCCFQSFAQSSEALGFPDSLLNYTCQELRDIFIPMERDSLRAILYVAAHTYKAKKGCDTMDLVWSYRNLGYIARPEIEAMYINSMLHLTRNNKNEEYLTRIYCSVAIYNNKKGDYHNALRYHLRAYDHSIKSKNRVLQARLKNYIGNMKTISGDDDEAIEIFKELMRDFRDSTKFDVYHEKKAFLNHNFKIFEAYLRKEEFDSSRIYLERGIKKVS